MERSKVERWRRGVLLEEPRRLKVLGIPNIKTTKRRHRHKREWMGAWSGGGGYEK